MKIISYKNKKDEILPGVLISENVILNIKKSAEKYGFSDKMSSVKKILELEDELQTVSKILSNSDKWVLEEHGWEILAPIKDAGKIMGVALNYRDFCERGALELPKKLKVFGKYCNAINDNGGIFYTNGRSVTYEGELWVIIGKTGKNISAAKADEYIAGFTVVNDISANDRIREDIQLFRGKNMDGALPMGPVLVSKDEIDNPMKLHIRTMVDGDIVQDSCTDQMIFDIYQQIEYFSEFMTLTPGDIIATGTPAGTALQYNPPRFLKPGQRVVIEIEKIGRLETIIA